MASAMSSALSCLRSNSEPSACFASSCLSRSISRSRSATVLSACNRRQALWFLVDAVPPRVQDCLDTLPRRDSVN